MSLAGLLEYTSQRPLVPVVMAGVSGLDRLLMKLPPETSVALPLEEIGVLSVRLAPVSTSTLLARMPLAHGRAAILIGDASFNSLKAPVTSAATL